MSEAYSIRDLTVFVVEDQLDQLELKSVQAQGLVVLEQEQSRGF